ncbi:MAG: GNAT family N-acetyltransferase [Pseudomonadota bacterium]
MTAPHEIALPGRAAGFAAQLAAGLPAVETRRLKLRAPRLEDFDAYAEIATGPAGRFLIEDPSRENAWFDFAQMVAAWLLRGHGLWSVETKEAAELVGFVLIGFEPGDHEPELGYMLRPGFEGEGYAIEAAAAAKRCAFDVLDLPSLVSTVDRDNARSRRLAERLGGLRDAAAEAAHGDAILVYRYAKKEAA